jgi:hypothetical protein
MFLKLSLGAFQSSIDLFGSQVDLRSNLGCGVACAVELQKFLLPHRQLFPRLLQSSLAVRIHAMRFRLYPGTRLKRFGFTLLPSQLSIVNVERQSTNPGLNLGAIGVKRSNLLDYANVEILSQVFRSTVRATGVMAKYTGASSLGSFLKDWMTEQRLQSAGVAFARPVSQIRQGLSALQFDRARTSLYN